MKISIAKEHKDFFEKEGWIEFEELLTSSQLNQFNQAIDFALKAKLNTTPEKIKRMTQEELYAAGRDLSRHEETLRKLVTQPKLAEIASSLVGIRPLRLGYDQLLPPFIPSLFQDLTPQTYEKYIDNASTLEGTSCVKEVAVGLIICLGPDDDEENLFNKGSIIFFNPQAPLDLVRLKSHPDQRYLLIVYTESLANYILQVDDPHTHDLKNLGYVFNDKLRDKTHPIVYR
jgi:hypothetical protein